MRTVGGTRHDRPRFDRLVRTRTAICTVSDTSAASLVSVTHRESAHVGNGQRGTHVPHHTNHGPHHTRSSGADSKRTRGKGRNTRPEPSQSPHATSRPDIAPRKANCCEAHCILVVTPPARHASHSHRRRHRALPADRLANRRQLDLPLRRTRRQRLFGTRLGATPRIRCGVCLS